MKLALGTVQFGLDYGVANTTGQVAPEEISRILSTARDNKIGVLDTAIAYGDSEARLGVAGVAGFKVVSKLPGLPAQHDIADLVGQSLLRLGIPKLHGLLLHRPADLLGSDGARLYADLSDLKAKGLVEKLGISIYDPSELSALADRYAFDIVQAPYNVLDRRLQTSGWLSRLKASGVEIHTRSAFMQGLLLMRPDARPAKFSRWAPIWSAWHDWLGETGHSALEASLGFALGNPDIDKVIVGVDSSAQLEGIIQAASQKINPAPASLASEDIDLISPANWASL